MYVTKSPQLKIILSSCTIIDRSHQQGIVGAAEHLPVRLVIPMHCHFTGDPVGPLHIFSSETSEMEPNRNPIALVVAVAVLLAVMIGCVNTPDARATLVSADVPVGWAHSKQRLAFYNDENCFLVYSDGTSNLLYRSSTDNVTGRTRPPSTWPTCGTPTTSSSSSPAPSRARRSVPTQAEIQFVVVRPVDNDQAIMEDTR